MSSTRQIAMRFPQRGGVREGAGRKRTVRSRVAHRTRPRHVARNPLHLTMRIVSGVPSLREARAFRVVRAVVHASAERFGFRVVHFSVQSNHLHLIGEAEDRDAITRGMKGLGVRLARALNRLWNRRGRLIADRFHSRVLATPREVKNALRYVFHNAQHHGERLRPVLDPCSSAIAFDGWLEHGGVAFARSLLARASTWLLAVGWKRDGLLSVMPG